jgi:serine acetyltransferase
MIDVDGLYAVQSCWLQIPAILKTSWYKAEDFNISCRVSHLAGAIGHKSTERQRYAERADFRAVLLLGFPGTMYRVDTVLGKAMSVHKALQELQYLAYEIRLHVNVHWWRWISCWFSTPVITVITYRLDRFFFLLLGPKIWPAVRIPLALIGFVLRPWLGHCEIHYTAAIGKGLRILHPSLGVVVSGYAVIGNNLILTGGNCIGGRKKMNKGDLALGNNINVGANAVILGPVRLGNNVQVGAGAVVVRDAGDNVVLVGVPAHSLGQDQESG